MEVTVTQLPYCGDVTPVFKAKRGRKKLAPGEVRRQRSPENAAKFANDATLESVADLLYLVAMNCHRRVMVMGLSMDFDDVLQEMHVSYLKAKEKWKPEGGALFNTYCKIVCENNFNHAIKKMERDRREMGMVSIYSMDLGEDGTNTDPMEVMHSAAGEVSDQPDFRLQRAQEMKAQMTRLSPAARRLVSALLSSERSTVHPAPRLRDLSSRVGLEGKELQRVKLEILKTYGVSWQ